MRGLSLPYGFRSRSDSVGGSVAKASEANVSMIKFTHNICTALRGESCRDGAVTFLWAGHAALHRKTMGWLSRKTCHYWRRHSALLMSREFHSQKPVMPVSSGWQKFSIGLSAVISKMWPEAFAETQSPNLVTKAFKTALKECPVAAFETESLTSQGRKRQKC